MVIAITGGHGFLGREIAAQAAAQGHEVVALGRPDESIPSPEFSARLAAAEPDALVHAAGPASVARSVSDPDWDRAGSVGVCQEVLREASALPRPPRVSLISSAAVYGQPESLPVAEDAPLRPVSPYGRHRVECEELIWGYGRETGAPVVALRLFSAYGEGLRRQLLWDIAQKALGGGPVSLGGTGDETRDFVHVADAAAAVLLTLAGDGRGEERLNVASGQETTIRRVAGGLLEALGLDPAGASFSGQSRPGDPKRWCADVTRLRARGFRPAVAFDQGLRRYADWVRAQAGATG